MALQAVGSSGLGLQGYGGGSISGSSTSLLQPTFNPVTTFNPQPASTSSAQILQPTADPNNASFYSAPSSGGGGGGGGGTSSGQTAAQQQAAQQAAAQQAAAHAAAVAEAKRLSDGTAMFNTQQGVVDSSASNAAANSAGDLKTSILDYIDSLKANQVGRDNQSVQDYLAKQQGAQGISDMVGQGIRSGGVMLNNGNAGDSSAAGAIAHAYGQLGRAQLSGVGNQFALAEDKLKQGHDADAVALGNKLRDLPQAQSDIVNSIVSDAQQKLGAIDQQMAYMSLPDRVNMEAQKQQITNDVLGKLQGFDQILSSGGNQALVNQDQGTTIGKAGQLFSAGTAPESAFQFNTDVPAQFQGTGASPAELPIFTTPRKPTV